MIDISEEYKIIINTPERHFQPKLLIYFDGEDQTPIEFNGDDIFSLSLLEERKAENGKPFGSVSANSIFIELNNSDKKFTQNNVDGPYYGKIRPNIMIKPYLGLELSSGDLEYIPLGVFWTGEWQENKSELSASVTCMDRMAKIKNMDLPMIPVVYNTNIRDMFFVLFEALGLPPASYIVDSTLTQEVPRGWFPNGKVTNSLNCLCESGNCNVAMDRYDIVRVDPNVVTGEAGLSIDDENQIESGSNPVKYLDAYSRVNVKYKIPFVKEKSSILKLEKLPVASGNVTLSNLTFFGGPLVVIDSINITCTGDITVMDVDCGAWSMSLTLENNGDTEEIDLEVFGRCLDLTGSEKTAVNEVADFDRTLSIENHLIQDETVAVACAQQVLDYVKNPDIPFAFGLRGNPAVEINDIINAQAPSLNIATVNVTPTRITLDYNGDDGLYCRMEARKVI